MKPRPYQQELRTAIRQALQELRDEGIECPRILVVLPTGGGKTYVGTREMLSCEKQGKPSLFNAPRRELVHQTAKRIREADCEPGIIMAGEPLNTSRLCQVASFDTLHARAVKKQKINLPPARLLVVDEAHLSLAETRENIIRHYDGKAVTLGLTATPARGDGRPLGGLYHRMVIGWSERQMMDEGYLVDAKYFAPSEPDLKAVRVRAGDYVETDAGKVMDQPKLVGEIVDNWERIARGESTVVFCVTKAHARHVTAEFQRRGHTAECVVDDTPAGERKDIFERVESGETTVLVNVFVASYGLDIPRLRVCVIARPTRSIVLYKQMGGRVLRPVYSDDYPADLLEHGAEWRLAAIADGPKPYAIVIDHAGVVAGKRHSLGFLDDPVPWTLEGDEDVREVMERERQERGEPKELTCPRCKFIFKGTKFCPKCGYELLGKTEDVPTYKADLVEVVNEGKEANRKTPWTDKAAFMGEAKHYAASKGYKDGFASSLYREKFGVWPNDPRVRDAEPRPPTALLIGYIKHRAIKRKNTRRVA